MMHSSNRNKTKVIHHFDASSLISTVFASKVSQGEKELPELCHLSSWIDEELDNVTKDVKKESLSGSDVGRLGPDVVNIDTRSKVGSLHIDNDEFEILGEVNFSTVKADVCVYNGKWQYEVLLGSKGIMQMGWCTYNCKFTSEQGVGDTNDSYAFDGNRICKWNLSTKSYGDSWLTGDIITCLIDLDNGEVEFCRNGQTMGVAFENVRTGPSYAYFPAVSLSVHECVHINFGNRPMRYPVAGYSPLQAVPIVELSRANQLIDWLDTLLQSSNVPKDELPNKSEFLLAANIFQHLVPLLGIKYIVEASLFRIMLEYVRTSKIHAFKHLLDYLLGLIESSELELCLYQLIFSLLMAYRFTPVQTNYDAQAQYMRLFYELLSHNNCRRFVLRHILFDQIPFTMFFHIKPPDEVGLQEFIPYSYWKPPEKVFEKHPTYQLPRDIEKNRDLYMSSIENLKNKVEEIETMQVDILDMLLTPNDYDNLGESSREIFVRKCRDYLRRHASSGSSNNADKCPTPVNLCFFHRLSRSLQHQWKQVNDSNLTPLKFEELFVPGFMFYDGKTQYFALQRLGGLLSHVSKHYTDALKKAPNSSDLFPGIENNMDENSSSKSSSSKSIGVKLKISSRKKKDERKTAIHLLLELADDLVLLYHIAGHKQLGKMNTLRDSVNDLIEVLCDTEMKLKVCENKHGTVYEGLVQAQQIFHNKASDQSRHMAWILGVVFTPEKMTDITWLWLSTLKTLLAASSHLGKLFAFVPEFYVESCLHSFDAAHHYFKPAITHLQTSSTSNNAQIPFYISNIEDMQNLRCYSEFLSTHFTDSRIVGGDIKDMITQSLACMLCYQRSLQAMESMDVVVQEKLIKELISPYENRAWAQTNWILVRMWKGNGFGFRYTKRPHVAHLPDRTSQHTMGMAALQNPLPAKKFQALLSRLLKDNEDSAAAFLNSVINQLNWAFSEFVGVLQELHRISSRPDKPHYVDPRQLKICATCFDLSVGLLRTLELVTANAPFIFSDPSKPTTELLLSRLWQVVCHILNRLSVKNSIFEYVLNLKLANLDTVDHYPILTAVVGIMIQLILKGLDENTQHATRVLMKDAGFSLETLLRLITPDTSLPSSSKTSDVGKEDITEGRKSFSFRNYVNHISIEEIEEVDKLVNHLQSQELHYRYSSELLDDSKLCAICYAQEARVKFVPCGHTSCRACITHHLMNKKECFYCKVIIKNTVEYMEEG